MTICTHTIVRNGASFIEPCLRQVLPHITRALVSSDLASTDGTPDILRSLEKECPNLRVNYYMVNDPFVDLVREKNRQIQRTVEDWFWVMDDDEYYMAEDFEWILSELEKDNYHDCYALRLWFLLDKEHSHPRSSNKYIERIFRNKRTMRWEERFMEEKMFDEYGRVWTKYHPRVRKILPRYIHFTMLKENSYRNEFNLPRRGYGKIGILPQNIINEIKKIYENRAQ